MLSIGECKKTLNQDGITYTDEEVKEIREFLYTLGNIYYDIFQRKMEMERGTKVVHLNNNSQNTQSNGEESDTVHPRIYRRAS